MNIDEIKHWEPGEVRTTRDAAKQLGITTSDAYKLLCEAEKLGNVSKYGYRTKDGWEDPKDTSRKCDSLGWQKNEIYTALALAGDWWWDENFYAVVVGGTALWEAVGKQADNKLVRLARLDNKECRSYVCYVQPETAMRLVAKSLFN